MTYGDAPKAKKPAKAKKASSKESGYNKPLPNPQLNPEVSKPFWDGTKKHELWVQYDRRNNKFVFPPREVSTGDLTPMDELEWTKVSGKGRVYSYTMVYQSVIPAFNEEVPYVNATIQLDEGVRMTGNVPKIATKLSVFPISPAAIVPPRLLAEARVTPATMRTDANAPASHPPPRRSQTVIIKKPPSRAVAAPVASSSVAAAKTVSPCQASTPAPIRPPRICMQKFSAPVCQSVRPAAMLPIVIIGKISDPLNVIHMIARVTPAAPAITALSWGAEFSVIVPQTSSVIAILPMASATIPLSVSYTHLTLPTNREV